MHPIVIATLFLFLFMLVRRIKLYMIDTAEKPSMPDASAVQDMVRELECELLTTEELEKLSDD